MRVSRRELVAASLILACTPRSGHPVRPAARRAEPEDGLAQWLAAFNDERASAYPDFVKAYIPALIPYLDDDLGLREATGGFTLLRLEQTAPGQLTAWLRDRNWERFSKAVLRYSTIDDLHRFGMALRETRLLDARHLGLLTAASVQAGHSQWSLGLRVAVRNGEAYYGHGGSAPGVNADFAIYPHSGYTVIVLANRGHPHAANVAEFMGARLPRAKG